MAGETVIEERDEPVFHEYWEAPAADKVADCPAQIVMEFTATTGSGRTVTVETAVSVQPPLLPVTV